MESVYLLVMHGRFNGLIGFPAERRSLTRGEASADGHGFRDPVVSSKSLQMMESSIFTSIRRSKTLSELVNAENLTPSVAADAPATRH